MAVQQEGLSQLAGGGVVVNDFENDEDDFE